MDATKESKIILAKANDALKKVEEEENDLLNDAFKQGWKQGSKAGHTNGWKKGSKAGMVLGIVDGVAVMAFGYVIYDIVHDIYDHMMS